MKAAIVPGLLLFACALLAHAASDLPPGWRFSTSHELADDSAQPLHHRSKVTADFNGDGIKDEALLLKSERLHAEGLWVRLSARKGEFRWIELLEMRFGDKTSQDSAGMGIDIVPPGTHAYACFDSARECVWKHPDFQPKLKLKNPAVLYSRLDSAASMFFWSPQGQRFLHVWLGR